MEALRTFWRSIRGKKPRKVQADPRKTAGTVTILVAAYSIPQEAEKLDGVDNCPLFFLLVAALA